MTVVDGQTQQAGDPPQPRATVQPESTGYASPTLARQARILDAFIAHAEESGLVGEQRNAKLLYLAVVSRLLQRPVSVAIKGPSSAGKSNLVDSVLGFFPSDAYYALSAMSERALVYSTEPLTH